MPKLYNTQSHILKGELSKKSLSQQFKAARVLTSYSFFSSKQYTFFSSSSISPFSFGLTYFKPLLSHNNTVNSASFCRQQHPTKAVHSGRERTRREVCIDEIKQRSVLHVRACLCVCVCVCSMKFFINNNNNNITRLQKYKTSVQEQNDKTQ